MAKTYQQLIAETMLVPGSPKRIEVLLAYDANGGSLRAAGRFSHTHITRLLKDNLIEGTMLDSRLTELGVAVQKELIDHFASEKLRQSDQKKVA